MLPEQKHREYLDVFLQFVDRATGQEEKVERISRAQPLAQDNLNIARDVGYKSLANEYVTLLQAKGFNVN